jgi:hypothetical protein
VKPGENLVEARRCADNTDCITLHGKDPGLPANPTDLRVPVPVLVLVVQQVLLGATLLLVATQLLVWGWVPLEHSHRSLKTHHSL